MGKVIGGLHGRPAGSVGGLTYGAARTREGKVVTVREKVAPANPNSVDQTLRRNIFKEALYATRYLTAACWQDDWNRSIGQLPGFQAMMSIIIGNTDDSEDFQAPPTTPLGNLHYPTTPGFTPDASPTDTINMTWSTELGLNGTADDELVGFCVHYGAETGQVRSSSLFTLTEVRSDGAAALVCPASGEIWVICTYFKGAGNALGLITPADWRVLNLS